MVPFKLGKTYPHALNLLCECIITKVHRKVGQLFPPYGAKVRGTDLEWKCERDFQLICNFKISGLPWWHSG